MGLKHYKPTSSAIRSRIVLGYEEITNDKPEKRLTRKIKNNAGRNSYGRLTVRHKGGGNKRRYRIIDFKRDKDGVPAVVKSIEYDPNRSSFIALVVYEDGEKRYILAPANITVGQKVFSGIDADIKDGNSLPLYKIPTGTIVHNIELVVGKGGQLARSAGSQVTVMAKNEKYATLKMPSGEIRLVNVKCRATIGAIGNSDNRNILLGKAGASRWRRKRPTVRGSVMNPCDHPHGGGEGKAPIGRDKPRDKWGNPALGYKTRKKKKLSSKYIVRSS